MAAVDLQVTPVPVGDIDATGTADSTTFLRGDGTWATPPDSGGSGGSVTADTTTLTDDTAAALDTWEQWGTETITIPNPGTPVTVDASLAGSFRHQNGTSRRIGLVRVRVSLDGGATWFASPDQSFVEVSGPGQRSTALFAQHLESGTPTGDIVIQAQLQQLALGAPGDCEFRVGNMIARVY